jgi:hypothetical protein
MLRFASRSLLGLALALLITAQAGAITAWDQAKVTALAYDLENSVEGLRDALRESPQWTYPAGPRAVLYQIRDNLRWIESEAISLHAMLAKGEGMDATLNSFRRIQSLKRETEDLAQRAQATAFTKPALAKAETALAALAAYYPADASNP